MTSSYSYLIVQRMKLTKVIIADPVVMSSSPKWKYVFGTKLRKQATLYYSGRRVHMRKYFWSLLLDILSGISYRCEIKLTAVPVNRGRDAFALRVSSMRRRISCGVRLAIAAENQVNHE